MSSTILLRILRTVGNNLLRHAGAFLTAASIMTLLSCLLSGVIFVQYVQAQVRSAVSDQFNLAVPFASVPDGFQVASMEHDIRVAFPAVQAVTYISPDDAMQRFVKSFDKNSPKSDLVQWLQANVHTSPLPASMIVQAEPRLHASILDWIAQSRYGTLLDMGNTAAKAPLPATQKVIALDRALTTGSLLTAGLVVVLAALVTAAVLRLTLYARRSEIAIMRMVGATGAYIQLPFLLEGSLLTMGAAVAGLYLTALGLAQVADSLLWLGTAGMVLHAAVVRFWAGIVLTTGWMAVGGLLLGWVASWLAVRGIVAREEMLES